MQVSIVERIEVDLAAGPFADCPVRQLTKPPDFTKRNRYVASLRQKHLERAALGETGLTRQISDFGRNRVGPIRSRHAVRLRPGGRGGIDGYQLVVKVQRRTEGGEAPR